MLNDPNPSFTKNSRLSSRLPASAEATGFSSDIPHLGPAPASVFTLNGPSMASIEISPVGSAGTRLYDSMVMVLTGQRAAHSPQRIQRVSSFNMAEPVTTP